LNPAPFKVRSEQDMNTAADLERELEGPVDSAQTSLLIDLSRCEFIDSTGIALLVRSWQALEGNGNFALCGVGDQVKRVLDITGLEQTIPTHPDREQALARLRG
jgi:anti-sigma B factor antagonist